MALLKIDPDSLTLSSADAREAAQTIAETYQAKEPYPHGCVDDFLPPEILDRVLEDLKELPTADHSFDRAQERLKSSYVPERLPSYTRSLFYFFNSRPFIQFVEEMTGIQGLIPDPYFSGAGIHVVANGGHLDIHADFNHLKKINVERRVNILIYLNKDWKDEYGGALEIWDKKVENRISKFTPHFNRMCCFNTGSDTFHGNPEPVNNPNGTPRRSIALYYYTATWDGLKRSHTTQFRPRPDSIDKRDWSVARHEFMQDILPPIVYRRAARVLQRLGF